MMKHPAGHPNGEKLNIVAVQGESLPVSVSGDGNPFAQLFKFRAVASMFVGGCDDFALLLCDKIDGAFLEKRAGRWRL